MNLDQRPADQFLPQLDTAPFDELFARLFGEVSARLEKLIARTQPDVVGCTVLNPTWPGGAVHPSPREGAPPERPHRHRRARSADGHRVARRRGADVLRHARLRRLLRRRRGRAALRRHPRTSRPAARRARSAARARSRRPSGARRRSPSCRRPTTAISTSTATCSSPWPARAAARSSARSAPRRSSGRASGRCAGDPVRPPRGCSRTVISARRSSSATRWRTR